MSRPFKVGDRVRIVSLDCEHLAYFPCEDQGLVVGGGGVVNEILEDAIAVETDGPEGLMDPARGHGWTFYREMLELVDPQ